MGNVAGTSPVQRINYGVIFKEHAELQIAQEHWLHTFEIPIPQYIQPSFVDSCQHSNNTCLMINQITAQINTVRAEMSARLSSLLDTIYTLIPETSIRKGRGKRSILPFIGQLSKPLFGTATIEDVEILAKHMNVLTRKTMKIVDALEQHQSHLSSYISSANRRMDYLMKGIKANEEQIQVFHRQVQAGIHKLQESFSAMASFTTSMIEQAEHLNHDLDEYKLGIIQLAEGILSPTLIPVSTMQSVMNDIRNILQASYSKFHLVHTSAIRIYSLDKFLYARQNQSIYITVKFPIAPQQKPLKLYEVSSFPVPINTSSSHGTQLLDFPTFFAVTSDQQFYVVFNYEEISACSGHKHLSCHTNKALVPVTTQSCTFALFINNKEQTNQLCNFRFIPNVITSNVLEIVSGTALIYRTPLLSFECSSGHQMIQGCDFCIVHIPCQCTLLTNTVMLLPRLTSCRNVTNNITTVHHFNLALLQKFFDNSHYQHLFADSTFVKPVNISLPSFNIYTHKMHDIIVADTTSHLDLDKMAQAAKQDTVAFKSLSEPLIDGLISVQADWPGTTDILTIVSIGISLLLCITVGYMFFRLRKLAVMLLVLQQAQSIKSLSTEVPSFVYKTNNISPPPPMWQIDFDPSWEHAIFLLCFINFVAFVLYALKQSYYKHHSTIQLEITCGDNCVLIPVLTLPLCPSYCQINLPSEICSLQITGLWYNRKLSLQWPNFQVTNSITNQCLLIPEHLSVSLIQFYKLRQILQKPFFVYLHVEHNNFLNTIFDVPTVFGANNMQAFE